jgi:hypothetical protein
MQRQLIGTVQHAQVMSGHRVAIDVFAGLAFWTPETEADRVAAHESEAPWLPNNSAAKQLAHGAFTSLVERCIAMGSQSLRNMSQPDSKMLRILVHVQFNEMEREIGVRCP